MGGLSKDRHQGWLGSGVCAHELVSPLMGRPSRGMTSVCMNDKAACWGVTWRSRPTGQKVKREERHRQTDKQHESRRSARLVLTGAFNLIHNHTHPRSSNTTTNTQALLTWTMLQSTNSLSLIPPFLKQLRSPSCTARTESFPTHKQTRHDCPRMP